MLASYWHCSAKVRKMGTIKYNQNPISSYGWQTCNNSPKMLVYSPLFAGRDALRGTCGCCCNMFFVIDQLLLQEIMLVLPMRLLDSLLKAQASREGGVVNDDRGAKFLCRESCILISKTCSYFCGFCSFCVLLYIFLCILAFLHDLAYFAHLKKDAKG